MISSSSQGRVREGIMAETTTPRLMAAAKEFNIGKETLVDFLVGKGFSKDDLKPTSKLSEDMYRSLQQEFQGDKNAKIKSDQIDLPKGSLEAKKKKEEEDGDFLQTEGDHQKAGCQGGARSGRVFAGSAAPHSRGRKTPRAETGQDRSAGAGSSQSDR